MAFGKKFDKNKLKLKEKRKQQNPLFKRKKFCRFTAAGVDSQQVRQLSRQVPLQRLGLAQQKTTGEVIAAKLENRIATHAVPIGAMLLLFMVVMSSAPALLNTVLEEKMQKISEVLLASVSPFQLMLGKLFGTVLVSLTLSTLYLVSVAWMLWKFGLLGHVPGHLFAWFFLFQLLALLMFGSMFIAVGAACSEIRDALAYLRTINSPADDLAFERIVNVPKRGLGDATVQLLHDHARKRRIPLFEAARAVVETDELKPKARGSLRGLVMQFDRWRAQREVTSHTELAEIVLDESGYTEMWQKDRSADAAGRLDNLKELVRSMEEFENLQGFLEHISLVMDRDGEAGDEAVSLMTLHSAKGLEFDNVFLPGWEEGLFPSQRTLDEQGRAGLEEERRLAHVGLTRARRRAKIYFATNRRIHGTWSTTIPSRFLDELRDARALGGVSVAAIGPGTAGALAARNIVAEGVPYLIHPRELPAEIDVPLALARLSHAGLLPPAPPTPRATALPSPPPVPA